MTTTKQVIGGPLSIGGRVLSLSRAIRAGDFVFLTGQVPLEDGKPMTHGTIEEQTRVVIEAIRETLAEAGCDLGDVVKAMVWLSERADFPGFNAVYAEYFPVDPPAPLGAHLRVSGRCSRRDRGRRVQAPGRDILSRAGRRSSPMMASAGCDSRP